MSTIKAGLVGGMVGVGTFILYIAVISFLLWDSVLEFSGLLTRSLIVMIVIGSISGIVWNSDECRW
ncbi:hypothetical protein GF312_16220 [Candidatus Poribacteria bacterium]|nr:hypothetical protein [Candidatus Poribacteria bacterium]